MWLQAPLYDLDKPDRGRLLRVQVAFGQLNAPSDHTPLSTFDGIMERRSRRAKIQSGLTLLYGVAGLSVMASSISSSSKKDGGH